MSGAVLTLDKSSRSILQFVFPSFFVSRVLSAYMSLLHRTTSYRRYYEYHILGKFQAAAVEHAEEVE